MSKPKRIILAAVAVLVVAALAVGGWFMFGKKQDNGLTPEQEALVVTAKAMVARGSWAQYDDSRLVPDTSPALYRWQYGKRTPEQYTEQWLGYTNCAAFCHDIYWNALDYDIIFWNTDMLIDAGQQRVYYHKVTGEETEEKKKQMQEAFEAALQPGDLIVYKRKSGSGHVVFYAGDGLIIHSSGGSYNYAESNEKFEEDGTVLQWDISHLFDPNDNLNNYLLGNNVRRVAIVRPLMNFTGEVPEHTKNRIKNLQDIRVQKLSSHPIGHTAAPGQEITFTVQATNLREKAATVEFRETVPEGTVLVSDTPRQDEWLYSKVKIPAGETAEFSYTVRVGEDATGTVSGGGGDVSGVPVSAPDVYIGAALTAEQQAKLAQTEGTGRGLAAVNGMYRAALGYAALDTDDALSALNDALTDDAMPVLTGEAYTFFKTASAEAPLFSKLAPTLYGGRRVMTGEVYGKNRTRLPYARHLMVGDILLEEELAESGDVRVYMMADNGQLLDCNGETPVKLSVEDSDTVLMQTMSYARFAVLRGAR